MIVLKFQQYRLSGWILSIFILFCAPLFSQNEGVFERGKEQYAANDYEGAITSWKKILDSNEHSAALYYNLGNASYKLNRVGPSIYYYEKALQLAPNNSDIKNNLKFAQNARVDAIEPLPKTFIAKGYENLYSIATYDTWAKIAVTFSILCVLFFIGYYLADRSGKKRLFLTIATTGLLFMLLAIAMAYSTYNNAINSRPAILFDQEIEVKSEPSLRGTTSFILHEGTKVEIIATEGDWTKIVIANGKDGWITSSSLKAL